MHYISNGWPHEWKQLPQELHAYWNYREDMSIEDGIATKGHRILIPSMLQRKALQQIHKGHQGVEKCMLKARESIFWPRISDDIRKAVERCGTCQASSRAAKPLGSASKVPPHLWHTLGTNLFYWNKIDFLMISDYFTKFIIVREDFWTVPRMPWSKNSEWSLLNLANHSCWEATMDRATVPRSSRSSLSSIKCTTSWSSPHHPRSNGFAKALVGIAKWLMEKAIKDENHGTMDCYNIKLLQFPVTSHHC